MTNLKNKFEEMKEIAMRKCIEMDRLLDLLLEKDKKIKTLEDEIESIKSNKD